MLTSEHYYSPLDIVKENVPEIQGMHPVDEAADSILLENHISVVMPFNEDPLKHIAEISNVNEKTYKWAMGYKGFQVLFLVPEQYKSSEMVIREKIGEYVDLKYWTFLFGTEAQINDYFNQLKSGVAVDSTFQLNTHFYIIDRERNMRGRFDDDGNGPIYGYDATSIAELHKKVVPDLRVLFQEYRDRRTGKFDSDQRRIKELEHEK